jgi:hypothetical protein
MNNHETITGAAIKVTPAISGAWYSTMTLNEWVALATLIYIVLQAGLLIPKYISLFREKK